MSSEPSPAAGAFDIQAYMADRKAVVDRHLDRLLPVGDVHPSDLHGAMRYALFVGGKRIRPILALATGEALGTGRARILDMACALEMIHAYSLIHDDLPAMDDDDYRRGQPTLHRKFGEAVAILAGNALLTLAFRTLARLPLPASEDGLKLELIDRIGSAAGTQGGMLAGQALDLASQGHPVSEQQLQEIHAAKTGALISVSVCAAALLSSAPPECFGKLERFGSAVGLAFQIADDLLDVAGGSEADRDERLEKATYPGKFGRDASREMARRQIESAIEAIQFLGSRGAVLRELARFVSTRRF